MEIEVKIDSSQLEEMVRRKIDKKPLMMLIGHIVEESVDDNFAAEGRPDPWKKTVAKKGKRKILEGDSRRLREGIHIEDVTDDSVTVAPDALPYARIHQLGGVIVPKTAKALVFSINDHLIFAKSVTIPARPYMAIQDDDVTEIQETVGDFIVRALA